MKRNLLLLCAVGCGLAGCGPKTNTAAPPEPPVVAVAKAEFRDLSHNLVLTAEFNPYQEVDVMAKVSGYIRSIGVDIGDHVRKGQVLAVLEIPEMADDLRAAQASVQRSEAQAEQAREQVKRAEAEEQIAGLSYRRLADVMKSRPGLVAQQEVDDAQAKDNSAQAQVSAARSNLTAGEQQIGVSKAELAKVQTLFDYTNVTAPFDGVVTRRYANTGSMIQAGIASQTQAMPVVRISQNSLLRLILPVPESAVETVHVGQAVDVHVPNLNRTFAGKVARFEDKLSLATRTMDTEVDVPNPGLILIPGMYAEVDLTLKHEAAALAVPVNAVDPTGDSDASAKSGRVMVVTPDDLIEVRPVKLGMETSDSVEITDGLHEGERVVIGSRSALHGGLRVVPKVTRMTAGKQ